MRHSAETDSPLTSVGWQELEPEQRLMVTRDFCRSRLEFKKIEVTRVLPDGQIFVNLTESLPPQVRGTLLLDFEHELKVTVDSGLIVWCEPLGDKSTLRNLRGIQIRTEKVTNPHR